MALAGACVDLICGMVSLPFMIGMASHLILDVLGKRPVRLFYPLGRGVCLKLCRTGDTCDHFLQKAGLVGTILALVI